MNGAIVTALNEAETIGDLVADLHYFDYEVCVVDDGSKDATGEIAQQMGAHVIYHAVSKGIGKSLMEAWGYAIKKKWKNTLQIDAGGSHEVPFSIYMLDTADIVIGSRFMKGSFYHGRKWRAIASMLVAKLLNFTTHQKLTDWTSGYRVFSQKALTTLSKAHYLTNMHTWQIEVLAEAVNKNLTIAEFPISYRAGNSTLKLSTIDDLIRVYLWVFNL